jgi:hypothetical protein
MKNMSVWQKQISIRRKRMKRFHVFLGLLAILFCTMTLAGKGVSLRAVRSRDGLENKRLLALGTLKNSVLIRELSSHIGLSSSPESLAVKHVRRGTQELFIVAGSDKAGLFLQNRAEM